MLFSDIRTMLFKLENYVLLSMIILNLACNKNTSTRADAGKNNLDTLKNSSNQKYIYNNNEYTIDEDSRIVIQNSFPKSGIQYTDSIGRKYVYAVFWTRIINESDTPLKIAIDFPLDSFELPPSSSNFTKLLIPAQAMTIDKEDSYDYGLGVKSFLDNNRHKSNSLKTTIEPQNSKTFYVVTLSDRGVNGILRAALCLKDRNLYYKINDLEIYCGNLFPIKHMPKK